MSWQAQTRWVWGEGEASPRNVWRCFRKTFTPTEAVSSATLKLTADSRYVLFANGAQLGRGPVRSWPWAQAFDTYDLTELLEPGAENVIAVLVTHYGVSTFSYLRGRAGLLAELEVRCADGIHRFATDTSWKTAPHTAFGSRSPRMCVQLAFTEHYDARSWDDAWTTAPFDDSGWEPSCVIGPVGTPPWDELVPRNVPFLTDTPVLPARAVSVRRVVPVSLTTCVDIATQMLPDSAEHANAVVYAGYLATILRLEQAGRVEVGSVLAEGSTYGTLYLDGRQAEGEVTVRGPERYLTLELAAGDHLLLLEVSGPDRGGVGLHLSFDTEVPFSLVSPLDADDVSSFVTLGPLDAAVVLDHRPNPVLAFDPELFARMAQVSTAAELLRYHDRLRPVPQKLVSTTEVFSACVHVRNAQKLPLPDSLHGLARNKPTDFPVFADADTEIVLDFGREVSGFLGFAVEASAGTILDFYGFEDMQGDWRQDTYGLDNTLRYTCREGEQRYLSPVRRGFRFLMVVVRRATRAPSVGGLELRESTYPVQEGGNFSCSDPLLDDIWKLSRETLRLCMEDTYVDCPAYEQTFWVGDARNAALVNSYSFGADALTRRCLELVPGSRLVNPLLLDQVPSGWNSVIPNWTFLWVVACWEFYERTGDAAFVRSLLPTIREVLEAYLAKRDARGLMHHHGWNFFDWAPLAQPKDGTVAHQNMFMVLALKTAANLAELSGEGRTAIAFRHAASELTAAINVHLWSGERHAYFDALQPDGQPMATLSLQTQIVAFLAGVAADERQNDLEAHLTQPPDDFVKLGSPFVSFFLYEALAKLGRLDLALDDVRLNYGAMLTHGSSTCWEMYPSPGAAEPERDSPPQAVTRSHCHAWSTAPGFVLGAHILGVQPLTPGWTKVRIAPNPVDLSWARGRVPHPAGGYVEVFWEVKENGLEVSVGVPEGVEVEVATKEERV